MARDGKAMLVRISFSMKKHAEDSIWTLTDRNVVQLHLHVQVQR